MTRRALLTGATGFVGRRCLDLLVAAGWETHAVARTPPADETRPVVWHAADLRDPHAAAELVARVAPTHLLHAAWNAVPGRFWRDPDNLDWLAGGIALVRAFGQAGGARMVGVGTCAEYDWREGGRCVVGVTPCEPATVYGRAKLAMRHAAAAAAETLGFEFCWALLFAPYGAGEPPGKLIATVAAKLARGERAAVTDGLQRRDFLHVSDVAAGLVAMLEGESVGVFNLASGRTTAVRDVVAGVAARLGRPELIDWGAVPPRAEEPGLLVAEVAPTFAAFPWWPRIGLEAGLDEAVAAWRKPADAA